MTQTVRPDEWHSDKWSHESLMDMQARMAPDDIRRIAEDWKDTLRQLDSLFMSFLEDVTAMIEDGWSGPGARAALSAMREYVNNSRTALDMASTLSSGLDVLATATSELQQKIAPPLPAAPADRLGEIPRWNTSFTDQLTRWEQALHQVQTVYSAPAIQAGNAVAELVGPRERLRWSAGPVPEAMGQQSADEQAERAQEFLERWGLGEYEQDGSQALSPITAGIPMHIPVTVTGMPQNPFSAKGSGIGSAPRAGFGEHDEDQVYAGQNWMRDPLRRENHTRSAGIESAVPTQRGTLPPDRISAFGAGIHVASASGNGGGVASRSWGATMPVMGTYPAQTSRRRGDENEHYSPPYLVNADNTRELLGDLPKGSAPVIGLWDGDNDEQCGPTPPSGFRSR